MTTQQAIGKIKEMGFTANLWEKNGKSRIYVSFNFKGMTKDAGFIGNDKVEFVTFTWARSMAATSGVFLADKNSKLAEIAQFEIDWSTSQPKNTKPVFQVDASQYSSLAERDRLESEPNWTWTHDL